MSSPPPPPPPPGRPKSPKATPPTGARSPSRSPTNTTTLRLNMSASSSAAAGPATNSATNTSTPPTTKTGTPPAAVKRSNSPKPPGSTGSDNANPSSMFSSSLSRSSSPMPPDASTKSATSKKRKFNPTAAPVAPHLAMASFARVWHQTSSLSFVLVKHKPPTTLEASTAATWTCQGTTTLYVVDTAPPLTTTTQLAFHLRGSSCVDAVHVETLGVYNPKSTTTTTSALESWNASFYHLDPLAHVLIKPAPSYTEPDHDTTTQALRYDADAQSCRWAAGMTTGLRAASIASNMGEVRVSIDRPNTSAGRPAAHVKTEAGDDGAAAAARVEWMTAQWKRDLLRTSAAQGAVMRGLYQRLTERSEARQEARMTMVAQKMAQASHTDHGRRAFKITIQYHIPCWETAATLAGSSDETSSSPPPPTTIHEGGLHAVASTTPSPLSTAPLLPPHVYTTASVFGDHEGTRSWLPCLDSASYKHRASQQLTIKVTAPMREGLVTVGCGEDFGVSDTYLHYLHDSLETSKTATRSAMEEILGQDHVQWVQQSLSRGRQASAADSDSLGGASSAAHVIPMDEDENHNNATATTTTTVTSIDNILATNVWSSNSWMPIPARSLGFAIGPFKILEDPEYFKIPELGDEDDDDDDDNEEDKEEQLEIIEKERERVEHARHCGEGIRQVYFAPLYERKYTHMYANTTLLEVCQPNNMVEIQLQPQTGRQVKLSKDLDRAVLFGTTGVPHRALSLMRDILALPAYRTSSYTQIWIPRAVNGGSTTGTLHSCPEVLGSNTFLGGAIMDAGLLPPVGKRIPFYQGGRVLQMLQARCAVRGWIIAALPLGGQDDVGMGYIHALIENFLMSLYERGHGAQGEGGAKGSMFYTKRYAISSGLNSSNLDFLPVRNVEEEIEVAIGGVVGAVPVEDRNNAQLWRSTFNGTESHTSGIDEFAVRQVLCKDAVDVLERGTDKDNNATSSSDLGGGALELVHATGGVVYRALKTDLFRRVVEGRAGVANFIRLARVAFIAAHLDDMGEKELKMPRPAKKKERQSENTEDAKSKDDEPPVEPPKPKFIICVNELLKKKGLTHTLFTRVLQNLAGRVREASLLGALVDIERESIDPRTKKPFTDPEAFPNSYVRGASSLYLRVGVHVEPARDAQGSSQSTGVQLQAYAEPVIPEGGIAYGGPITFRVVENEGQLREFVKEILPDGSRRDWQNTFLHAKPVTTPKAQMAASGSIETTAKDTAKGGAPGLGGASGAKGIYTDFLHGGGYQAIELIRLTNLTPLLWVRVDPMGLYGGRISVFQPDACLAEQLFHDGDAAAQVDAMRSLAERPLRIQGSVKVTAVYDVKVSELPVRILGDCLRGSPALHSSLPHTPSVRAQAAVAIAQWQNNKAPPSKDAVGTENWLGINLLIQYFKERFYSSGIVMPVKFTRIVIKKNEVDAGHDAAAADGAANPNPKEDFSYQYLDSLDDETGIERAVALEEAEGIDVEEDEEYRVRSAVIASIASIRAKDGLTPPSVLQFMETVLQGEDTDMFGNIVHPDEDVMSERKIRRANDRNDGSGFDDGTLSKFPYVSSMLLADSLLALCHINAFPSLITDPATGKPVQSSANHPVSKLMDIARRWLDWELYRETIRSEVEAEAMTGVASSCYDCVAACAVTALSSLAILRQSTTDSSAIASIPDKEEEDAEPSEEAAASQREKMRRDKLDEAATVKFYTDIFDKDPPRSDVTKAACAQAIACICCASDRFEMKEGAPMGLLAALEFLLDRIVDPRTSPSLRHTLSLLMMDACTGKICSMQRVGSVGGRNDLVNTAARFLNGPLGASHGGDSGSASLISVSPSTYPAANAVNDGARRGLRLLSRAGHTKDNTVREVVVRVARFATNLWRTINGELVMPQYISKPLPSIDGDTTGLNGVCAFDGHLRCSLLALWQWIWPNRCLAVLQVHAWKSHEGTQEYKDLGANLVMQISDEEKAAASAEEASLEGINRLVNVELERQKWRGGMALKAYEFYKAGGTKVDAVAAEQGIGQPLPPIQRDTAFKQGGWVASAAQQRRALALDGGTAVTKLRLTVKGSD